MQTFLPYSDFDRTAACLDRARLGKQRIECIQILKALADPTYGWQSHPAVLMWRGHTRSLCRYGLAMCRAWLARGYVDNQKDKFEAGMGGRVLSYPVWLGNERFHAAHRAALLFKNAAYYGQFGWTEEPKLDYWWPK